MFFLYRCHRTTDTAVVCVGNFLLVKDNVNAKSKRLTTNKRFELAFRWNVCVSQIMSSSSLVADWRITVQWSWARFRLVFIPHGNPTWMFLLNDEEHIVMTDIGTSREILLVFCTVWIVILLEQSVLEVHYVRWTRVKERYVSWNGIKNIWKCGEIS